MLGLDYFRKIVEIQKPYCSNKKRIINGIQTNGTLLTEEWCRFLAEYNFAVGLSMDGPQELHDLYRVTRDGKPTHDRVMQGYQLLLEQGLTPDILCVVNAHNVRSPNDVYGFFKEIKAAVSQHHRCHDPYRPCQFKHCIGREFRVSGRGDIPFHHKFFGEGLAAFQLRPLL